MLQVQDLACDFEKSRALPGITVVPLFMQETSIEGKVLGDAVASGELEVLEKASSTVPRLNVNSTIQPVIGIKGTLLVGGGQDRHLEKSFILGVGNYEIPVQCVQHGRWNPNQNKKFVSGDSITSSSLRYHPQTQQQVWEKIKTYETITSTHSGTESFTCSMTMTMGTEAEVERSRDTYKVQENDVISEVRERAQNLSKELETPYENQVGIITIQIDPFEWSKNETIKLNYLVEMTSDSQLWKKLHKRVIDGLVYDASVCRFDSLLTVQIGEQERLDCNAILQRISQGQWNKLDSVGIEERWRLSAPGIYSEAISFPQENYPVHLLASG